MKTLTLVAFLGLASIAFGADDIRSKVTEAKAAKNVTRLIDPDKSIFGIPLGTQEDKFTEMYGKPMGYLRLNGPETAMLYGKSHAFIFEDGKLAGIYITHTILDWKLASTVSDSGPFAGIRWQLPNGIENEMSLKDVKRTLGDKLSSENRHQCYFLTDKARVELAFSHYTDRGDNEEAYTLFSILVKAR